MEVVKGNPQKGNTQKEGTEGSEQKLSYEQLNNACNQLWQQNQQLLKRNAELEQFSMFKRLDYLFKVLEFKDTFSADFVGKCVAELTAGLTVSQDDDEISKKSQKS